MGAFSSISTILNGSPGPYGKGTMTIREGTFTSAAASCTMPVGNLSSNDLVEVRAVQAVTGFVTPIEVKASRTTSNTGGGVVTVAFEDGSTGPASTQVMQVAVYRNT